MSGLPRPSQSVSPPENSLGTETTASANPEINPTVSALAPSTLTRKIGIRLWTSSEEASMNRLTKPSAQTPLGTDLAVGLVSTGAAMTEPIYAPDRTARQPMSRRQNPPGQSIASTA